MNDMLKVRMQETGECIIEGLTVLEVADIVSSLGLDPRTTRIYGDGRGMGWRSARLVVTEDTLMGGKSVTLR